MTVVVSPAGEVTVRLGTGEITVERGLPFDADGYSLWVSDGYGRDASVYAQQLREMVAAAPPVLRSCLRVVAVMSSYAPGRANGAACAEAPGMLVIWRVAANQDRPGLAQAVIDHELAHLAGWQGGPPADLVDAWRQARRDDQRRGRSLARAWTDSRQEVISLSDGDLDLLIGSSHLTERCAREARRSGDNEDWATSVACYAATRRRGFLIDGGGGDRLDFEDLFPGRAALLDRWLA